MAEFGDKCTEEGCDQSLWAPQSITATKCSRHSGTPSAFGGLGGV